MKKKIGRLIFMLALAFLVSCQFQQKSQAPITASDLRQGTDALVMNFVNGIPPERVYESRPKDSFDGLFDVSATLQNKGATDISNGYLAISYEDAYISDTGDGWKIDDEYAGYGEKVMQFDLLGKSLNNPNGDFVTVSKKLKSKLLEEKSESHVSTILLTACYKYQTFATENICIDPDPTSQKPKPCTVKDVVLSPTGAPIAVTKIESNMLTRGRGQVVPEFRIYIANKGNGQPFNEDLSKEACGATLTEEEKSKLWNIVSLNVTLGGQPNQNQFKCSPLPFKLERGQDYVRCIYDGTMTASSAYTTPISIELSYGYTQTISKNINIEKNPSLHAG